MIGVLLRKDYAIRGFPDRTVVKNLPANAGDTRETSSIPGSGRSLGVGNGDPLQDACLENSMDRGAWQAIVHGSQSQTRLSTHSLTMYHHQKRY